MKEFDVLDIYAKDLIRGLSRLDKVRAEARLANVRDIGFALSEDNIRVLWRAERQQQAKLPAILIGAESTFANLLPKMLALPGALAPITSFMKAWSLDDVRDVDVFSEEPLTDIGSRGFIGLIVGELMATAGPDVDLDLMGMDSVRRTLSFVCAQAMMKGRRRKPLISIVERWIEASTLTSNEVKVELHGVIADLCEFFRSLLLTIEGPYISARTLALRIDAWIEKRHTGQEDFLRTPLSEIVNRLEKTKSRENRFDIAMEALNNSPNPLAHGFLISLIEPGSMEFLDLAKRVDRHGCAAIAYCLCIAILEENLILRAFNGFGLIISQQGLRPDVDVSTDISIAELRIFHDSRRTPPMRFRTRSPWLIDVELAPMISGSFGNVTKRRNSAHSNDAEAQALARISRVREGLMTAMRALEKTYGIIDEQQPSQEGTGSARKGLRR
ncbi:hypothetical protein [Burkholderia gladioli]|uniref:hypothetical protein n=1 Tax=Burkholderia gladioli TaxID=28095 RepID=UPI001056E672|nr:hypothetical protein [Burkholderia gladioli]